MIEQELRERGSLVYTTRGSSMLPLLREKRDLVVIRRRPEERLRRLDAVLFKRRGGDYVLHRVVRVRESDYLICGDNQIVFEAVREDQILGILTEIVRDRKTISVNACAYRLYARLWWGLYPVRFLLRRARNALGRLKRKLRNR